MKKEVSYGTKCLQSPIREHTAHGVISRPCVGSCYANEILQSLNISRKNGVFTDLTLQVEGQHFPCHRVVLCAKSAYFQAMFTSNLKESHLGTVNLPDVSAPYTALVLDFMYEGRIPIEEENVQEILRISDFLDISSLRNLCVKFLERQLGPSNCVGIKQIADKYYIPTLSEKTQKMMMERFTEVSMQEEFLDLSKEELIGYLSSDDLVVSKEEVVFEAVLRWVGKNKTRGGAKVSKDLLEHVRLPLLDPAYYLEKVEMDKIMNDSPECFPLFYEAQMYHILGNSGNSIRMRPRRFMDLSEMTVVIGGCDKKGVLKLPYIDSCDPKTGTWTGLSGLPGYSKSEMATCVLKNNIYISGGHIHSREVWMLNVHVNSWIKVASLNTGRWRHGMVTLKGQIYAVGGFDGQSRLSSMERYSSFTNSWTTGTPMLEAVSSAGVVSWMNKLYVIGGAVDDYRSTDKVQCYDPVEDKWTYKSPAPFCKDCISAVELDGTVYVIGGLMSTIFRYKPEVDVWNEAAALPGPLESCGVTVCGGKIYILGGRDENGEGMEKTFVYDPLTNVVSEGQPLLRAISHHGCVTVLHR
ncbi:PREDICTED: kelch-like protein 35 [Nanorana parkeri]|uniref:kelch-like protein 35 n=1 Tax=Nanorana parkeri TaxID=125878 RepID=UPI000854F5FB|nr:PREDICTED: kelch-like protein 35 [Nanorana parkeri]